MSKTVEIYGRDDCRFCAAAIALCEKRNLPFVYHDLGSNLVLQAELEDRLGHKPKTVPQIFIGAHKIGGYEHFKSAWPVVQQIIFGG